MKRQFKFNPLATAILTLLCGHSVSSFADSSSSGSQTSNDQLNAALQEQYPGQQFYQQYYVDKKTLPPQEGQETIANRWCEGVWAPPFATTTKAADAKNSTSVITADQAYYNPKGDSVLSGNVEIDQEGRLIRANEMIIDQTQTFAKAKGNVQIAQGGLITQSNQIDYNLKQQTGELDNSFYISEATHAHGHADKIQRTSATTVVLQDASYSTCPPEQKPTWKIQAKRIELNQETGRGVTRNTKFYVKDTPVLAVPYFNFPIDDRRTTGLLTPTFGFTNHGGFQISTPIYLNLAPNYDLTFRPEIYSNRGLMLNGEFRYMTEDFGAGKIWGGYLPSDRDYAKEDRKDLHINHFWSINKQWSSTIDYNYVSDKDFFTDLNDNPNSKTDLNQRRAWELNYANGIPGLSAKLRVESFQTLDKNIAMVDRPYSRLPQLFVNYIGGSPVGFEYEYNNDTAYFKKNIDTSENPLTQPSGMRFYNQFATRYNFRNPWGFIVPELSVRSIHTSYDQDTTQANEFYSNTKNNSVVVPQFTLDTGLSFEREGKFLQTVSPRVFYAYSPYRNQDNNPNFDSTTASINYDQLFNPTRFYGHDRLDDNNFASVGISYSLVDPAGLERLRAGIGQSFFFDDRRVLLSKEKDNTELNTAKRTGPIVSLSSQLSPNISVAANSAWMSNGNNAQHDLQFYFTGNQGNLYNFGYFYRDYLPDRQAAYHQVVASFVQPVKGNWRIMGHAQYDIDNHVAREYLLGVNYESCCWGISVYGRSYFNDLDDVTLPDAKPKRAIMAELTFKGLGGFNNKLSSLLNSRVLGYDKVNQSWTH